LVMLKLFRTFKFLKGIEKLRAQTFLLGTFVVAFLMIISNVLLPAVFKIYEASSLAAFWVLIWIVSVSYIIVKQRLFGIKHIMRIVLQTVVNFISLLLIFISGYLVAVALKINSFIESLVIMPIFIIAVVFFNAYNNFITSVIDKVLKISIASTRKVVDQFSKNTAVMLDINIVMKEFFEAMDKAFGVEKVFVRIAKSHLKEKYIERFSSSCSLTDATVDILVDNIDTLRKGKHFALFFFDDIKTLARELRVQDDKNELELILHEMVKNNIELIIVFNGVTGINGIILIQEREFSVPFTQEEVNFLESILSNLSLALGRSFLYQEVQNFNTTLQAEVNDATRSLNRRIKQLISIRKKEQDMLDIMGHELRTPATVIRLNSQMIDSVKNRIIPNIKDDAARGYFERGLPRIIESIDQEIGLIGVLLTSAKISGDRLVLNREKVDLPHAIDMGLHAHEPQLEKKNLKVEFDMPKENEMLPHHYIFADRIRVQQIIDNLIGNAVKYTDAGKITVRIYPNKEDKNFVEISIKDTGRGIPKDDLGKLGEKFYRVDQYIKDKETKDIVRPGGTGLGLFVAFELVKAHDGKIWVESEFGKGSTFFFTLPIFDAKKHVSIAPSDNKNVFERSKVLDMEG